MNAPMRSRWLSGTLFALLFSVIGVLGSASAAYACGGLFEPSCVSLTVDLKTDFLPGVEFIAARTILTPSDRTQTVTVFTDSRVDIGIRTAEMGGLEPGDYHVEVQLLDASESVIASHTVTLTLLDNLSITVVESRSGPPAPACEDQLANAEAELASTQTQLAASQTDLAAALSQLASTQGDLDTCNTRLTSTSSDLAVCSAHLTSTTSDLAVCDAHLASIEDDPDGDGVVAILDHCPGTPAGAAVDASGCSNSQFCTRLPITTGTDQQMCRRADWRGDEAGVIQPNDCTVTTHACVAAE